MNGDTMNNDFQLTGFSVNGASDFLTELAGHFKAENGTGVVHSHADSLNMPPKQTGRSFGATR